MIKTTPSPATSSLSRLQRKRRQSKGLIAESSSSSSSRTNEPSPGQPPPIAPTTTSSTKKKSHHAQLVHACLKIALEDNALFTKYELCPSKARKTLILREKAARHRHRRVNGSAPVAVSTTEEEEAFLKNPPVYDEEYSSGDDDDYEDIVASAGPINEPYYTPTLPESACASNTNQSQRLPFNYRKIRYFDVATAQDRAVVRGILRGVMREVHLLRVKSSLKNKSNNKKNFSRDSHHDQEEEDLLQAQITNVLSTISSRLPRPLTPGLSSSLLTESLLLNPRESIEGLSLCYDGIVSAGLVVLDSPSSKKDTVDALGPLLIASLPRTSGEVLLGLSSLRNCAGTKRYGRRLVQRLSPYLVRPPDASMWCLRHQSDMEAIVAGVELILEYASRIFCEGWVERGRRGDLNRILAEKKAFMLRSRVGGGGGEGMLGLSLNRRKRESVGGNELADWEADSIERQVRQSVGDIFSKDWSRISALNLSPTESDTLSYGRRRSSFGGNKHDAMQSLNKSPRVKIPLSPRGVPGGGGAQIPSVDALESTFGPSFSSQDIDSDFDRPLSPPSGYTSAPLSPTRESSKLTHPKTPPHENHADPTSPGGTYRSGLAPLSPQSSVGAASTASSSGALSSRSVSAPAGSKDQYRALTSTAAERKRTVAACRALRAQITKFEDSFIQIHGRAPKGATERAPLASTYMQYREWKRAIRADAACRIQALCRGALVRSMMVRSLDPRVSRIVATRRARMQRLERRTSDHLRHLSIPLDIGGSGQHEDHSDRGTDSKSRLEARTNSRGEDDGGVEVVMRPNSTMSLVASSGWKRQQTTNSSPGSHSHRPSSGKSLSSLPDVTQMSLPELQQRKRELKQQLKMYDLNFHAQHGRMPEKREKEPIRHLYESYNAYKNQITVIERGEAQPGPGTAAFRGRDVITTPIKEPVPERISPSNQSPASKSPGNEGAESPKNAHDFASISSNEVSKGSEDVIPEDLVSLKAEKATLHQMLRSYEKDFFKQHKRQVSSFSDIRPVAGQYRRYKEIKKAIAQLQDK